MNKNFKRIITFALAVACITFGFYSCNDADSSNSSAESSESSTTVAESSTTSVGDTEASTSKATEVEETTTSTVIKETTTTTTVKETESNIIEGLGTEEKPLKEGQETIFTSPLKSGNGDLKIRVKVLQLSQAEWGDLEAKEGKEFFQNLSSQKLNSHLKKIILENINFAKLN